MSIPEAGSGDVARELGRAALMVHPSRGEGFGLPLIEAMASATPMILSDIPVLREVAGDAALYVNPNDPRAWGEAITRLAGNESLRAHLVAAARIRLQRFTLESCGQALLATCAAACAD
jgi:glycosyltransferase involved in cell wall biosynthesis